MLPASTANTWVCGAGLDQQLARIDLDALPMRRQPPDLRLAQLRKHLLAPLAQQIVDHDPLFRCAAQGSSMTSSSTKHQLQPRPARAR